MGYDLEEVVLIFHIHQIIDKTYNTTPFRGNILQHHRVLIIRFLWFAITNPFLITSQVCKTKLHRGDITIKQLVRSFKRINSFPEILEVRKVISDLKLKRVSSSLKLQRQWIYYHTLWLPLEATTLTEIRMINHSK